MRARGDKERSWWSTAAALLPSQKARAREWPKAKVASGQGGREGNRCLEPKWLRSVDDDYDDADAYMMLLMIRHL